MQVVTNLRDIINHAVVTNVEFQNKVTEIDNEIDALALHRLNQYNENHTEKLTEYNDNDTLKMDQYNANHIERLENINYAYADRIVEMIKTRNFMGIMDEYVAKTATHMITFLDTTDTNYIYYANGNLLAENIDYTVYDSKTIELTVKANPYDVIVQVNTQILADMLTAEGALFENRIGQPNGLAGLDDTGKVPSEQLPSYVDDVIEVSTYADLPVEGETGKIYVVVEDETSDGNTSSYRWTGTTYAMVSNTLNAADVKALYEANPDTNEYSDAEKVLVDVGQVLETTATTLPTAINEVHNELDAHKISTGEDHTYIDQDVTTAATPTFAGIVTDGLVDGRDVSVDGAKLDTIEDGATADQTADEILTLLKTVDGSGSELDADLLDGQEGAYYLDASNINAGTIDDARLPDTITSNIVGNVTGNSGSATKLETARTINGVNFDGTVDIVVVDDTKLDLITAQVLDSANVKITGDQVIEDVKTFTLSPIVPTPTTGNQAVNKEYVDNNSFNHTPTIIGIVSFNSTTNNINLTNIVTALGLEIGDVIQISGATDTKNNSEFTVEVITDDNNIIVNQGHANKGTTKNVATRASDTGVTVKLLAKYYNASPSLGRDYVNMVASRAHGTNYINNTKREMIVAVELGQANTQGCQALVDGKRVAYNINAQTGVNSSITFTIPDGSYYSVSNNGVGGTAIYAWYEIR